MKQIAGLCRFGVPICLVKVTEITVLPMARSICDDHCQLLLRAPGQVGSRQHRTCGERSGELCVMFNMLIQWRYNMDMTEIQWKYAGYKF